MKTSALKFLSMAAATLMCGTVSAGYLYFWVENAYYKDENVQFDVNFDHATVSLDGYSYLYLYQPAQTGPSTVYQLDSAATASTPDPNSSWGATSQLGVYAEFKDDSPYTTFLVELWSSTDESTRIGWQNYSLAKLLEDGNIATSTSATGKKALVVSQVIPEPTSGILLLLGMAGLALRRRKA